MNYKAKMSKSVNTLRKFEVWIPIVLTLAGNLIFLTAWAWSIKSDIRHVADLLNAVDQRVTRNENSISNLVTSQNSLWKSVSALNALHNLRENP